MSDSSQDEARRLLKESLAAFREAHVKGMDSLENDPTHEKFGEAIREEWEAFEKHRNAIELY